LVQSLDRRHRASAKHERRAAARRQHHHSLSGYRKDRP
jgi:hypothetical protein